MIQQEYGVVERKNTLLVNKNDAQTFFSFSDREKYAWTMTSSSCLSSVHKIYHYTIKN